MYSKYMYTEYMAKYLFYIIQFQK